MAWPRLDFGDSRSSSLRKKIYEMGSSFPVTRHNNGCTMSFADGHAEVWRWLDPDTACNSLNPWLVLRLEAQRRVDCDLSRMFQVVPLKVPLGRRLDRFGVAVVAGLRLDCG